MWYVIYGIRILGMFPQENHAKQFLKIMRLKNWSEFKHDDALSVAFFPTPMINNLTDLTKDDDNE
jgi:hypothetical protein